MLLCKSPDHERLFDLSRMSVPPIRSTGATCASHSILIWMLRKKMVLPRDARFIASSRTGPPECGAFAGRVARVLRYYTMDALAPEKKTPAGFSGPGSVTDSR